MSKELKRAQLDVIPPELKALDRWVLAPSPTSIGTDEGKVLASKDKSGWIPFKVAADCLLHKGFANIGIVAGDGICFAVGECPEYIRNPEAIWRWHPTFTVRTAEGAIVFLYSSRGLTKLPANKMERTLNVGFDGWAVPLIGHPIGYEPRLSPFEWRHLPVQHRSVTTELHSQIADTYLHIKKIRQRIAELKR